MYTWISSQAPAGHSARTSNRQCSLQSLARTLMWHRPRDPEGFCFNWCQLPELWELSGKPNHLDADGDAQVARSGQAQRAGHPEASSGCSGAPRAAGGAAEPGRGTLRCVCLHTLTRAYREVYVCLHGHANTTATLTAAGGTSAPPVRGDNKHSPQTWSLADSHSSGWLGHGYKTRGLTPCSHRVTEDSCVTSRTAVWGSIHCTSAASQLPRSCLLSSVK